MLNPPPPPPTKPEQVAKAARKLLQGKSFEAGVLTGIAVAFLARILFGS